VIFSPYIRKAFRILFLKRTRRAGSIIYINSTTYNRHREARTPRRKSARHARVFPIDLIGIERPALVGGEPRKKGEEKRDSRRPRISDADLQAAKARWITNGALHARAPARLRMRLIIASAILPAALALNSQYACTCVRRDVTRAA